MGGQECIRGRGRGEGKGFSKNLFGLVFRSSLQYIQVCQPYCIDELYLYKRNATRRWEGTDWVYTKYKPVVQTHAVRSSVLLSWSGVVYRYRYPKSPLGRFIRLYSPSDGWFLPTRCIYSLQRQRRGREKWKGENGCECVRESMLSGCV